jgi:hypothetical protein
MGVIYILPTMKTKGNSIRLMTTTRQDHRLGQTLPIIWIAPPAQNEPTLLLDNYFRHPFGPMRDQPGAVFEALVSLLLWLCSLLTIGLCLF